MKPTCKNDTTHSELANYQIILVWKFLFVRIIQNPLASNLTAILKQPIKDKVVNIYFELIRVQN